MNFERIDILSEKEVYDLYNDVIDGKSSGLMAAVSGPYWFGHGGYLCQRNGVQSSCTHYFDYADSNVYVQCSQFGTSGKASSSTSNPCGAVCGAAQAQCVSGEWSCYS